MKDKSDWEDIASELEEEDEERECQESCPHYDNINQCCWQSGEWGLCFHVSEGDYCHLGYKWNDGQ